MSNHCELNFSIVDQDNSDYPSNGKQEDLFRWRGKEDPTGMATTLRGINSRNCFIAKCQDLIRIRSSNVYSSIKCPSVQT